MKQINLYVGLFIHRNYLSDFKTQHFVYVSLLFQILLTRKLKGPFNNHILLMMLVIFYLKYIMILKLILIKQLSDFINIIRNHNFSMKEKRNLKFKEVK